VTLRPAVLEAYCRLLPYRYRVAHLSIDLSPQPAVDRTASAGAYAVLGLHSLSRGGGTTSRHPLSLSPSFIRAAV